jgi:hypothetical protein
VAAPRGNRFAAADRRGRTALDRFRSFCRFEPETGCVVWVGGKTKGRGHHVDYGAFWFEGRRWFAHRWSAKFVHGLVIEGFDVDHCCPHIALPNTLCVEHVGAETPARNRELQTQRTMIHLQVGLIQYEDIYGPDPEPHDLPPFFSPPAWLVGNQGPTHDDADDCPF